MDDALGYLITWRTYGTWLHGDPRGSADREHRAFDSPFVEPQPARQRYVFEARMVELPFRLDASTAAAVEASVRETAEHRGWLVHAVNARTNHVHVVVSAPTRAERVMNAFKANATRVLRAQDQLPPDRSHVWSRHGSTRYLWDDDQLASAIDYVTNQQGASLHRPPRR